MFRVNSNEFDGDVVAVVIPGNQCQDSTSVLVSLF